MARKTKGTIRRHKPNVKAPPNSRTWHLHPTNNKHDQTTGIQTLCATGLAHGSTPFQRRGENGTEKLKKQKQESHLTFTISSTRLATAALRTKTKQANAGQNAQTRSNCTANRFQTSGPLSHTLPHGLTSLVSFLPKCNW